MADEILRKVFYNKKNNQLSITIPRKLLNIEKRKIPKSISFKIKGVQFMEDG